MPPYEMFIIYYHNKRLVFHAIFLEKPSLVHVGEHGKTGKGTHQ